MLLCDVFWISVQNVRNSVYRENVWSFLDTLQDPEVSKQVHLSARR